MTYEQFIKKIIKLNITEKEDMQMNYCVPFAMPYSTRYLRIKWELNKLRRYHEKLRS